MEQRIREMFEKEKWEMKTVGEVATEICQGNGVTEEQLNGGDHPAVKNKDIATFGYHFSSCISHVDPNQIKSKKYCENGNVLVSLMGNRVAGKVCVYLGQERAIVGSDIAVIKHNQNPKYLSYVLSTDFCREQIQKHFQKGAVIHLHVPKLKQVKIPLPPRHIQDQIVNFLEQWTWMKTELKEGLRKD